MEQFEIEKTVWTDADFDTMGWHDCFIYGFSFHPNYEFLLDIDYIFKQENPKGNETYYKFWVAPCTLVFENVYSLEFDFGLSTPFELEIADIKRNNPQKPSNYDFVKRDLEYNWVIETVQRGDIKFKAVGYKQYVRKKPILTDEQQLDFEKRGNVSFERTEIKRLPIT